MVERIPVNSQKNGFKVGRTMLAFIFSQIFAIFDDFLIFTAISVRPNLKNHQICHIGAKNEKSLAQLAFNLGISPRVHKTQISGTHSATISISIVFYSVIFAKVDLNS